MQNEAKIEDEKININIGSKEEIENKKKEEENKLSNLKLEKKEKKSLAKLYIIPILLTCISIILYIMSQKTIAIIGAIIDILSIIAIVLLQANENKKYNKIKEEEKQKVSSIKNKIEVYENEIKEKEKIIEEKQNKLKTKLGLEKQTLKAKFVNLNNVIDKLYEKELTSENVLDQQRYINDLKLELSKLEMKREEIIKKQEEIPEIEEKLKNSTQDLEELESLNTSINIAKEALEKAYSEMRENVTPKFSSNLSKAIQNISSGKYKTVKVNESEGIVVETENGSYVPADVLSIGTIDELYLSLRISSINELTKETMPIILDETFAYFDNERLENVLEFLNSEYNDRQILILTCTDRESKILDNKNIKYNKIAL